MITVPQAIARILKAEGVKYLLSYPVNPLIEACAEIDIRTIVVRQERIGIHMADAISRLSSGDEIGVFCMQHGPGAENSFGAVAQCYGESVPVLIIPAGYNRELSHHFPNFNSTIAMRAVTKSAEPITLASMTPAVMRRAFFQLRNGRPGPVLVELPWDVASEQLDMPDYAPSFRTRFAPDPSAVAEAAEVLATAERPVIYAGQGIHYSRAWGELLALAELLNIPVTTSLEGKSAFPETHPLALGAGGNATPQAVYHFLDACDVLLGVGCSFAITSFGTQIPANKTVIHATLDPMELNKDVPAQYGLIGDARLTLQALIDELTSDRLASRAAILAGKRKTSTPAMIREVKERWLTEWMPTLTSNEVPITPYRVVWELNRLLDKKKVIITHDAGSPRDQLAPFFEAEAPLSYLGWGKTTQLGYGLGLALGAKLARPESLCINVWGDAAIGFTGMDFETAVRENLPILSILFNNHSMAMEIPIMPTSTRKYRATDIGGHYAAMAEALGGYAERITDPNEISAALKRGIAETEKGNAVLLEFMTCQELKMSLYKSTYPTASKEA